MKPDFIYVIVFTNSFENIFYAFFYSSTVLTRPVYNKGDKTMRIEYNIPYLVSYMIHNEGFMTEVSPPHISKGVWSFWWNGCGHHLPEIKEDKPTLVAIKQAVARQAIRELQIKQAEHQQALKEITEIIDNADEEGDWMEDYRELNYREFKKSIGKNAKH